MKILILYFLLLQTLIFASSDSAYWSPSGVLGVNASQVSFSNWAQGGENTISWTFFSNLGLDYNSPEWKFLNKLKLAYGRTKTGETDFKTNDNELYLETVLSYNVGWKVDPFFSNTVRTSLSKGFNYKVTPSVQIADFFDPGYISQSLGFTYNPSKKFNVRLGIALQETFTSKFTQYSDDPKTTNDVEKFKLETGLETVSGTEMNIEENLLFTSFLRLFTRFDALDVWDVRWDNTVTAKITKYLNVNLNILVLYEKSQSPKTQLKQALQMGFTYSLF